MRVECVASTDIARASQGAVVDVVHLGEGRGGPADRQRRRGRLTKLNCTGGCTKCEQRRAVRRAKRTRNVRGGHKKGARVIVVVAVHVARRHAERVLGVRVQVVDHQLSRIEVDGG